MSDDSAPAATPAGGGAFIHPRISGGDGSSLSRAVVVESSGMEMALMLMQLWLEQVLGLKGRDWLPGTERWVDSANHAPRTVRAVGVELRDGSQREYFFDLGRAASFGQETSGGPMPKPMPITEPAPSVPESEPVPQPPPVPRARALGLASVPLPWAAPEPAPESETTEIKKPATAPESVSPPGSASLELSELLNRKEPWPDAGMPGQRQGVDWGWWLTLVGCAALGAIAMAWWKPTSTAQGRRTAPTVQEAGGVTPR